MDEIQTFDLIGFKGDGVISRCLGHLQKKALKKHYRNIETQITHVGLAIRGEDILKLPDDVISILKNRIDSDMIYLFESNRVPKSMDKVPDVFGCHPKGVKLRPLKDIVSNFKGNVYVSHHTFPTNEEMLIDYVKYIIQNNHVPYERSTIVMLSNVIQCLRSDKVTDSVFCSELVAKVLIEMKVLPDSVNPEHVVPLDFYINPHDPGHTYDIDKEIPILFDLPIKIN